MDPKTLATEAIVPNEQANGGAGIADDELVRQIRRRRTFAIISHPDAGKTTLTEKLLLFGGAIQLAGEVKAKADRAQHALRLDGASSASAASRSPPR